MIVVHGEAFVQSPPDRRRFKRRKVIVSSARTTLRGISATLRADVWDGRTTAGTRPQPAATFANRLAVTTRPFPLWGRSAWCRA